MKFFMRVSIETVRSTYLADIEPLSDAAPINDWAAEKTHGKITEIIDDDALKNVIMVLTNAIYFNGTWVTQFDPEDTRPSNFRTNSAESIEADFMNMENTLNYTHMGGVKVLKMPYEGDRLSMLVMLPDDTDGIAELEGHLSVELLEEWRQNLHPVAVTVSIPKFTMSTQYDLNEHLINLGMPDVFDEGADLSGISPQAFVSSARQSAFVNVNEEGTEAVAVTIVTVTTDEGSKFVADHPFIFMIQDDESGMILFMGRMSAP